MSLSILDKMLAQVAVYWPPAGSGGGGQQGYGTAVEVFCRWEDKSETYVDRNNAERVSKSKVVVDRDLAEQGALWLSPILQKGFTPGDAIAALTSATQPFSNSRAGRIQKFDKTPTFGADQFHRLAWL